MVLGKLTHKGRFDPLDQQHSDRSGEFRTDRLGLHRYPQTYRLVRLIRLQLSSKQLYEGGLAHTILAEKDDNLGIGKVSGVDVKFEPAERFGHRGVLCLLGFLSDKLVGSFRDSECEGFFSESEVFGGDHSVEENVDTYQRNQAGTHLL